MVIQILFPMIRAEEFCLISTATVKTFFFFFFFKASVELAEDGGAARRGCCFPSSSVNKCRGDPSVRGREPMGSLISTPFYLRPAAPARQTPVLSHAGIPQEATLHEGQRSGKRGRLLVLSFTNKHGAVAPLLPPDSHQIRRYDTTIKLYGDHTRIMGIFRFYSTL